jgi:oxygen-dependent protoporphyrinogen oxidase
MTQDNGPVVAVVGSGASGLGASYRLQSAGFSVDLIEQQESLGGRFGVSMLGDRPVMMGGKNIGRKYVTFRAFTAALGDNPYEAFGFNSSRLIGDRLVTLDSSHPMRTVVNIVRMGTPMDTVRLVGIARRIRGDEDNRYLGSQLSAELGRKYDHLPISSHFSRRFTKNLLRPLTIRQTGAEPNEAYLGSLPTNVGALMDSYDQLRMGIQPVIEAFARRVRVRLGARVEGLILQNGSVAALRVAEGSGVPQDRPYDGVVLATPANVTKEIVRTAVPKLSSRLDDVSYFPSTVALVEYDRPVFTDEVRALAIDDGPCSNVGAYGKDDRHIARFTFSGRDARTPNPSEAEILGWVDTVESRLSKYLPFAGAQRIRANTCHWAAAYSGYTPFHSDFLSDVRAAVGQVGGLELAGDYLRGDSIEACFRSGTDAAGRLSTYINARERTPR